MIAMPRTAYANALYSGTLVPDSKLLQNVLTVVGSQILNTTHKPTGGNVSSENTWGASKNAVKHVASAHMAVVGGGISISFVGETHGNQKDQSTVASLLGGHANSDLIVYERGLHTGFGGVYGAPVVATNTAREEDLTTSYGISWGLNNFGVTPKPRDIVVAGYMVLCVASGNQNNPARILLFFGENHVGILHQFEEIAGTVAPWILKRKRLLHFGKSHDSSKYNKWGSKEK